MNARVRVLLAGLLALLTASALAGQPRVPASAGLNSLGGAPSEALKGLKGLFGDNIAFSAAIEMRHKSASGSISTTPGKYYFDNGKSRFEMDMSKIQGGPGAMDSAKNKSMGLNMDKLVVISRPDKKSSYMVYPEMNAYIQVPVQTVSPAQTNDSNLEWIELGQEEVDGHPCAKSEAVHTDSQGNKQLCVVWKAIDLSNFPIKIQQSEPGSKESETFIFKEVDLKKPEAALFEVPASAVKYDSPSAMMRAVRLKSMRGAGPAPSAP
jgi:hypothetical protein